MDVIRGSGCMKDWKVLRLRIQDLGLRAQVFSLGVVVVVVEGVVVMELEQEQQQLLELNPKLLSGRLSTPEESQ